MGKVTEIPWTDSTFSPWIGCQKVNDACRNCYAAALEHRWGHKTFGPDGVRRIVSEQKWREPVRWNAQVAAARHPRPHRVFCGSMCDVFEDRRELLAPRARLWKLIEATPALTWLLLTKRPENLSRLLPLRWFSPESEAGRRPFLQRNVWLMATAVTQGQVVDAMAELGDFPDAITGISVEPALGPVSFATIERRPTFAIWGAESGPGARYAPPAWARHFVIDCDIAGVMPFVKQIHIDKTRTGRPVLSRVPFEWPRALNRRELP